MFKECLRNGVEPFILDDKRRTCYLAGIRCWDSVQISLMKVCIEAQDRFQTHLIIFDWCNIRPLVGMQQEIKKHFAVIDIFVFVYFFCHDRTKPFRSVFLMECSN